jgi:hypothetical protein
MGRASSAVPRSRLPAPVGDMGDTKGVRDSTSFQVAWPLRGRLQILCKMKAEGDHCTWLKRPVAACSSKRRPGLRRSNGISSTESASRLTNSSRCATF